MVYRIRTLRFEDGAPVALGPGDYVIAVLSSHNARGGDSGVWYVTCLVGSE
jgi:hypothetical protein